MSRKKQPVLCRKCGKQLLKSWACVDAVVCPFCKCCTVKPKDEEVKK